jgi:hypothetical protein
MRRLIAAAALLACAVPGSASAQAPYQIPPDNPFVNTPGAAPEVYVSGLRNPFRWSFDRQTGDMLIGDVGGSQEEVTFLPRGSIRGANLGWNCWSGGDPGPGGCDPPNDIGPAHTFPSGGPGSGVVIGGYVVRDPAMPAFHGRYIYGDFTNGDLYWLGAGATGPRQHTGVNLGHVSGFGEDGVGHLWAASLDGPVVRLSEIGPGVLGTTSIGNFDQPVAVAAPPGDPDRLFIVEKPGIVRIRIGAQISDFLDISGLVGTTGGEEGLLAFAVAPDYALSGRVFAYYTDNSGDLQLDEYVRTAVGPDLADPTTRRPLLTIRHDLADNHNGGQLLFGPDDCLYLSTGDGGVQGDPEGDAQNLGSLLGKILRIDPDPSGPVCRLPDPPPPPPSNVVAARDLTGPVLSARVKRRQRVLRLRGAVAYASCNERCSLAAGGRLRVGRRSIRMRRLVRPVELGRRARLKVVLDRRGRRVLRRALRRKRRPIVRLRLRARDGGGNASPLLRRTVRVRR